MPRPISELTDQEITRFITNYERESKTEGGVYSLADLRVERLSRTKTSMSPREVYKFIVENASKSRDGKVTYQDIWTLLHPGMPWKGNHSIRIVGGALGAVIAYSVRHGLPIISTLVVQSGSRKLSKKAVQNIYDECKRYGIDVGLVPNDFVARETERARQLELDSLPQG